MNEKIKINLAISFFRLRPALKRLDRSNYKKIMKAFKQYYSDTSKRTKLERGIMSFHRMFLITGFALYKALYIFIHDKEKVIDIIADILWNERFAKNIRLISFFIRRMKDPFNNYLKILGPFNEWFFPCPPWEKERVEIENGIGWYQTKCPHYNFFKREGSLELMRAYCDMDERIAEFFPNHVELKREKTLARGNDHCDFLYYRK